MKLVTADQSTPEFPYEINCDQCGSRVQTAVAFETFIGAGGDIFVCLCCLEKSRSMMIEIRTPSFDAVGHSSTMGVVGASPRSDGV